MPNCSELTPAGRLGPQLYPCRISPRVVFRLRMTPVGCGLDNCAVTVNSSPPRPFRGVTVNGFSPGLLTSNPNLNTANGTGASNPFRLNRSQAQASGPTLPFRLAPHETLRMNPYLLISRWSSGESARLEWSKRGRKWRLRTLKFQLSVGSCADKCATHFIQPRFQRRLLNNRDY